MSRWLVFFAAGLSFFIYAYAIKRLFSREHGVDSRMKALQIAGVGAAVAHLWAIGTAIAMSPVRLAVALVLYGLGLAVFFAARRAVGEFMLTLAFSPDSPTTLLRTGIYSRIRHPFYTAYLLTWVAGIAAAPGIATVATTLLMGTFYWVAADREEQKFANSSLAGDYASYRKQAGRFWPIPAGA